jgi:pimeloyl-ACP methyl ester carboxylesterase
MATIVNSDVSKTHPVIKLEKLLFYFFAGCGKPAMPNALMGKKSVQQRFKVNFGSNILIGDVLGPENAPQVLVLHGAGNSNRGRFRTLREALLAKGITSAAFDFVGHGDTGGDLKSASLSSRTRQACRVVDALKWQQPLAVIGASMSAYTAVKLLEHFRIKNLILLVPAMYASQAYTLPFDRGFSDIIRQPQSWVQSDAWRLLADYTGRLLVVAGENDPVIPRDVINRIYGSAVNAAERKLYIAPNASHFVFTDLRQNNPDEFSKVFDQICIMLRE